VKLPDEVYTPTNQFLRERLFHLLPRLEGYIFSFFILGIFWIEHHSQFHFVKRTDGKFNWLSILFLMTITFVPFSTDLVGDYSGFRVAGIVFAANMLMVQIVLLLSWWYATKNHRLVSDDLPQHYVDFIFRKGFIIMIIFALALVMFFFNMHFGYLSYVLIPFVLYMHEKTKMSPEKIY
jgi:uncharacterized membrane protein